jgi:hypothetical protein
MGEDGGAPEELSLTDFWAAARFRSAVPRRAASGRYAAPEVGQERRCQGAGASSMGAIVQVPENCTPLSMNISGECRVPETRAGT